MTEAQVSELGAVRGPKVDTYYNHKGITCKETK